MLTDRVRAVAIVLAMCAADPAVAQAPDAEYAEALAKAGLDEMARHRLTGGCATALAFSPDGRWLAVGGECGDVQVHDISDPRVPRRVAAFDVAEQAIEQVGFATHAARLVVLAGDLSVWNARLGQVERRDRAAWAPGGASPRFALSRGGEYVAFVPEHGVVAVARVPDGRELASRRFGDPRILSVAFTTGDSQVRVLSSHGDVWSWAWSEADARVETVAPGGRHTLAVLDLPDGESVVVDRFGELRVGDEVLPTVDPILDVAASRDGGTIAVQMRDRALVLFDRGLTRRWQILPEPASQDVPADADRRPSFALGPDGRLVAIGGRDGVVRLLRDGRQVAALAGLARTAQYVTFTRSGGHVVLANRAATAAFPLDPGSASSVVMPKGGPLAHAAGEHEFAQFAGTRFRFVDARSGRIDDDPRRARLRMFVSGGARFLAASPRGERFVLAGRGLPHHGLSFDGAWPFPLSIVEVAAVRWQPLDVLEQVRDVRMTADGERLLVATELGVRWSGSDGSLVRLDGLRGVSPTTVDISTDDRVRYVADGERLVAIPIADGEPRSVGAAVRWLRCLDAERAVTHDGQNMAIWDLARLRPVLAVPLPWRAAVPPADADLRPTRWTGDPLIGWSAQILAANVHGTRAPAADPIRAAAIAPDRERIAFLGFRDVIVWERRP